MFWWIALGVVALIVVGCGSADALEVLTGGAAESISRP